VIFAAARPRGPATVVRQAGIDLVILQDASASMRVKDVSGDRWQRSVRFLRMLGDSLSWKNDRIAMAVFARIAAPQVRLTKDPNTFFFFLDHLERDPPFRLQEEGTWDTNLERGVHWGIRLLERDEELHGKSLNAKVFVMISDGQAWSGEVEKSILEAQARGIPIYTVGVGTLGGGAMPKFLNPAGEPVDDPDVPLRSRLDREALQTIAAAARGQYFELDRDGDRHIANQIIDAGKRLAPTLGIVEEAEELYWYFLGFAAAFLAVGLFFIRERADLWIQFSAAVILLATLSTILG
jgi:Ca-activated chloride channel family protein